MNSSGAQIHDRVLVVIALTTTNVQAAVEERLREALLLGGPHAEAQVYAKRVDELVAADLVALAVTLGGWQAVSRLRVGDVVGVASEPSREAGPPATTPAAPAAKPTLNEAVADEAWVSAMARKVVRDAAE